MSLENSSLHIYFKFQQWKKNGFFYNEGFLLLIISYYIGWLGFSWCIQLFQHQYYHLKTRHFTFIKFGCVKVYKSADSHLQRAFYRLNNIIIIEIVVIFVGELYFILLILLLVIPANLTVHFNTVFGPNHCPLGLVRLWHSETET